LRRAGAQAGAVPRLDVVDEGGGRQVDHTDHHPRNWPHAMMTMTAAARMTAWTSVTG
jgi:hypothetical protein